MSQEETKTYFDIERKKHFDFFVPFYNEKNWQIMKDNIDGNCSVSWDVKLEVSVGQYRLVDEKVRKGEHNDFLVEIIQDMRSGKLGWIFGEKDWILYGSWIDLEKIYPESLYLISDERLKNYIYSLTGFCSTFISNKGWGNTWNISLNWDSLISKGIVKKLI